MISVRAADRSDLETISRIAHRTWPITYGKILAHEQLAYMLTLFYSADALNSNIESGHAFYLALENDKAVGFLAIEHNYNRNSQSHIHKVYVLPEEQGKGIGRLLLEQAILSAKTIGADAITLNVNRSNLARLFYEKLGFMVKYSIDIELEHGYLMEDFVMEKSLSDL